MHPAMSITRRETPPQGSAWRADVAGRLSELERIVADLGHGRAGGTGVSSLAATRAPVTMSREQAVALTAAMYPGESSRRWRRPTSRPQGSMPVRLFFVLPADERPRWK